jgi:hypothetical protein
MLGKAMRRAMRAASAAGKGSAPANTSRGVHVKYGLQPRLQAASPLEAKPILAWGHADLTRKELAERGYVPHSGTGS